MNLPRSMNVVSAGQVGAADALRMLEAPVPQPSPGQVLIKVESASVNFSDVKRRRGDDYPFRSEFPFVPGGEVAGNIAAIGAGVDGFSGGQPVFALAGGDGHGGYAQYALAYAPRVTPIPPGMDFDTASGIIVAGATAALLVRQAARLQRSDSVLVPAATGAVGSLLIQLTRHVEN
jgi:NADPH:quinone reductase-like Zn-dependent oxidoreductase